MAKKLNARQSAFCDEYLIDLNGTQAAIRAGYSAKTARTIAAKLLAKDNIAARIAELKEKRSEATGITAEYMVKVMQRVLETDVTEAVRITREQMEALPKEVRQLVTHVKREVIDANDQQDFNDLANPDNVDAHDPLNFDDFGPGQKLEVFTLTFIDKAKVIEMLNKHVGVYEADNKQKSRLNISTEEPEVSELTITIKKAK